MQQRLKSLVDFNEQRIRLQEVTVSSVTEGNNTLITILCYQVWEVKRQVTPELISNSVLFDTSCLNSAILDMLYIFTTGAQLLLASLHWSNSRLNIFS